VPPEYLVARNEYGLYSIPVESRDRPAARTVLGGEVWEPATAALIAEHGRRGDVVTAGAYFGDMLPAAAAGGHTVYAAEPNPVNFAAAVSTLEANEIDNVRLVNAGFGAKPGTAVLEVADAAGTAHGGGSWILSRRRRSRRAATRIACAVTTIDDVVAPDALVSLVHLDVEGFESQALLGAGRTLARCKPDLLLETWPRLGRAAWMLRALGYRKIGEMDTNVLLSAGPTPS
jgi:FkbM family methyltransferase